MTYYDDNGDKKLGRKPKTPGERLKELDLVELDNCYKFIIRGKVAYIDKEEEG